MAISIKFTKFNNTPWGFRLAGGSDFPQPLTVIRITEGSLGECMGLKVGDVIVRLNDQPISSLTHGQAHEAIVQAGNNFVLAVQREEEARKAVEAISEENIVPYKIALADLPPVFPEQILKEETVIERYEEEKTVVEPLSAEEEVRREEEKLAEEKPVDANSEIVPNKNLTDDEIAQLILEEEELLSDKGLLGVNFKKLRPRAPILKDSKVLEELQNIATSEPERIQELKRTSTFLQKPQRPVPKSKCEQKVVEDDGESYKVVIKKQDKKTVITRLVEKGLLPPGSEASIAGSPEPPEPSEVKMHEMENQLKEDRPPVVFDPNSSCSTSPFDTDDSLSSRTPQLDSNETHPYEDQLECSATYNCNSKLLNGKSNHYRRYSSRRRSSFKGHYLENILSGYADSCVSSDRQIDDQFEFPKTESESFYFKNYWLGNKLDFDGFRRIILRNVSAIARHFRSKPKRTRVVASRMKRIRMKGRYLTTYLKRESTRLASLMTTLFQFLLQRSSVSESSNMSKIRESKRRLSFKGRYLNQVLQKNVTPVLQCVKETHLISDYPNIIEEKKDQPKSIRTKRMKRTMRGRYFERFVRRNLEILELFTEYICIKISEWFEENPSCISQKEFHVVTSNCTDDSVLDEQKIEDVKISRWHEDGLLCSLQEESAVDTPDNLGLNKEKINANNVLKSNNNPILSEEVDEYSVLSEIPGKEDTLSKFLQSTENYISTEVFHRGSRRFSKSRKSIDIIPEKDDNTISNLLQSTGDYVSTEVFHRGSRRLSRSSNKDAEQEPDVVSNFLQSTGDYVSTEIFHRGNRRLSKSSKDAEQEPGVVSNLLQSTGDYVSNEVFHRGSRRLSRSSKDAEQEPGVVSNLLQSTGDYVSNEVFHRGSRRLSRASKDAEQEPDVVSNLLQSTGDYVSNEVFHRGSRRFSRSSKDAEQEPGVVSNLLQSTGDYVSNEVFHRRSRRLSRASKDAEQEPGVLSNLLQSTGDYVSSEVFHRRSRRLSISSRRESVSLVTPDSKSMFFNLPWFSFKVSNKSREDCEKIDSEIERDNRRLSFVPTILYQSITNRIGVDFTRLVAYAFVPCTSIILLYMYQ